VQEYDALELQELWALAPVMKFLLLEEVITPHDVADAPIMPV